MAIGQVSVELKTKPHVKAFLLNNFGERPMIDSTHIFHNFLLLCLTHSLTYRIDDVPEYPETMKIYITKNDYNLYGCWMNPRQMQLFNGHVDHSMKMLLTAHTDTYLAHKPNALLKDALLYSLGEMKIDEDDWSLETITKYYYRSRQNRNKPLLYVKENKKIA